MTKQLKPMLAVQADLKKLTFPILASPKLDGIRVLCRKGEVLSRSLKLIPNRHIQSLLASPQYDGLDGEIIVGKPNAPDVYRKTESAVMSRDGEPDFTFWVFDSFDRDGAFWPTFVQMRDTLDFKTGKARLLHQTFIANMEELEAYEKGTLEAGYEGVMLRKAQAPYKFGRSTVNEAYLLKLKRFASSEFIILDVEPLMHNANEAETNELGHTKRSSHQENLVAMDTMGTLKVRDIHKGWVFNIGTGFTAADRLAFWKHHNEVGYTENDVFTYDYFEIGMKDVPRFPSYKGPRKKIDIS